MSKKGKEFKTIFSMSINIPTLESIEYMSKQLDISKSEVCRKIFEYFIEHNDIEDLQA